MRYKTLLPALFFFNTINAQITTTQVAVDNTHAKPKHYDSLNNFLGDDVNLYVGQELYLKPLIPAFRKHGYMSFFAENKRRRNSENIYKCCEPTNEYGSSYDSLAGKYFKVLGVVAGNDVQLDMLSNKDYLLKLEEKTSKDIVYYEYQPNFRSGFPFIVVGYFEKLKKYAIGREFVVINRVVNDQKDIKTAQKLVCKPGDKWKCTDVTVTNSSYSLSLILKDQNGQENDVTFEWTIGTHCQYLFSASEADAYKKRLGANNWLTILDEKVKIGMTKEMCVLSWGEPENTSRTVTAGKETEKYHFNDLQGTEKDLYFVNNVLTMIK